MPVNNNQTFVGGTNSKEWAKATIVLGTSFFIIIVVGFVWIEPIIIINSNVCGVFGAIVFPLVLIFAGIMGLKTEPLLANLDNGVISFPKSAVLFSSNPNPDLNIKIKDIKEVIADIEIEFAEKQLVAIKNQKLFVLGSKNYVSGGNFDLIYARYRRTLLRTFLIIDQKENHYFVTKDFDEVDEMISVLSTNV